MNKVILIGRLTKDPEISHSSGEKSTAIARYSLAVDRRYQADSSKPQADFINCVTFGKSAEFAEKYLHKGTKIAVEGRIQTGSYENKEGKKVYTTDVVVDNHEFAESANKTSSEAVTRPAETDPDGFMTVPDEITEELPFKI